MENGGGSYAEVKVKTDEKGHFRAEMVVSGAGKIIAKIKTENAACTVSSGILSKSYKYTTAPIQVKKNQYVVSNYSIKITEDKYRGAFNIAQNIYKMYEYFKNEIGYSKIPKVSVYWENGKGENSDTTKQLGMIRLAGLDRDEFDSSVICHEYAHWIYGMIRNSGMFDWGDHNSLIQLKSAKLAYSEGLATFTGQSFLKNEEYMDGDGQSNRLYINNLEDENIVYKNKMTKYYEIAVMKCLWDLYDQYSQNETWDLVDGRERNIFYVNKNMLENLSIVWPFSVYDIDLDKFYESYFANKVTPNTQDAYDFWNVFENNSCQYDTTAPVIILRPQTTGGTSGHYGDLDIQITDDIAVNKATITIDGGKTYKDTINWNFRDKYTLGLTTLNLKPGRHTLAVKATDFAGNSASIAPEVTIPKKLLTDGSGAYRTPYSMAYYSFVVPEEEAAALSGEGSAEENAAGNIREISEEPETVESLGNCSGEELPGSTVLLAAVPEEATPGSITAPEDAGTTHPLAGEHRLSHVESKVGTLADNAASETFSFQVGEGTDYALLSDDLRGDFALELTDPAGNRFYAGQGYDNRNGEEGGGQVVLNLGSQGRWCSTGRRESGAAGS